jgi:hypothetical protein
MCERRHTNSVRILSGHWPADSGRSQAAALAADEWARCGAREFKARVRLM